MRIARQKQSWISPIERPRASAAWALATALVISALATPRAQAQTYTENVIHSFTGTPDGTSPYAGLVAGTSGNLYGTTALGGASSLGAVMKVSKTGAESVLYSFTASAGSYPEAGLVVDSAGNLYGTTYEGGASGWGSVFKLTPGGKETTVYSFAGPSEGPDGAFPLGGLVLDSAGSLYGTTYEGGTADLGTVFRFSAAGVESVLHSFTGPPDGDSPSGSLLLDTAGNLYGATYYGGSPPTCSSSGCGTIFEITTRAQEIVLYNFTGGFDGANPNGGLIRDSAGNLYGTTAGGGDPACDPSYGCGTVFKLTPQ